MDFSQKLIVVHQSSVLLQEGISGDLKAMFFQV